MCAQFSKKPKTKAGNLGDESTMYFNQTVSVEQVLQGATGQLQA